MDKNRKITYKDIVPGMTFRHYDKNYRVDGFYLIYNVLVGILSNPHACTLEVEPIFIQDEKGNVPSYIKDNGEKRHFWSITNLELFLEDNMVIGIYNGE